MMDKREREMMTTMMRVKVEGGIVIRAILSVLPRVLLVCPSIVLSSTVGCRR